MMALAESGSAEEGVLNSEVKVMDFDGLSEDFVSFMEKNEVTNLESALTEENIKMFLQGKVLIWMRQKLSLKEIRGRMEEIVSSLKPVAGNVLVVSLLVSLLLPTVNLIKPSVAEAGENKKPKGTVSNTDTAKSAKLKAWGQLIKETRDEYRNDQALVDFEAQESGNSESDFDPEKSWASIADEAARYREKQQAKLATEIRDFMDKLIADETSYKRMVACASIRESKEKLIKKLTELTHEIRELKKESRVLDEQLKKHKEELAQIKQERIEIERKIAQSEKLIAQLDQDILNLMEKIADIAFKKQRNEKMAEEKEAYGNRLRKKKNQLEKK